MENAYWFAFDPSHDARLVSGLTCVHQISSLDIKAKWRIKGGCVPEGEKWIGSLTVHEEQGRSEDPMRVY